MNDDDEIKDSLDEEETMPKVPLDSEDEEGAVEEDDAADDSEEDSY